MTFNTINTVYRAYILNSNFDFNNNIYQINQIKVNKDDKLKFKKYIVKKRSYLNIIQKSINDNIITYCENFNIINVNKNRIIMKYNRDILDNEEFPPLSKYDIDEDYEEKEYITKYGKIIENKYESYFEINQEFCNEKYYDLIFV
jgi:hypothetical protein